MPLLRLNRKTSRLPISTRVPAGRKTKRSLFLLAAAVALVGLHVLFQISAIGTDWTVVPDLGSRDREPETRAAAVSRHSSEELEQNRRYLLYYTHSGFSNQLICLQRAASLALATNRTLVISPVLPHLSFVETSFLYPAFPYRVAGANCDPFEKYIDFTKSVMQDVEKSRDPQNEYPSFMELFGFGDIYQKTGLQIVDMREFAMNLNHDHGLNDVSLWCTGAGQRIENLMVPGCDKSDKLSFAALVPEFTRICGMDHSVAVIGSSYNLPNPARTDYDLNTYFKRDMTPSRNMMLLIKHLLSRLPNRYAGVAIRIEDNRKFDDCDSHDLQEAYEELFQELVTKKIIAQGDHGTNNFVLLSNGHEAALRCFRHFALRGNYRVNVSTVNDMLAGDEDAQRLFQKVRAERSTIYLLLDQYLVGLADEVAFQLVHFGWSSFHQRIKTVHRHKVILLEKIHGLASNE